MRIIRLFYNLSKCALNYSFQAYLSVNKHTTNSNNLKFSVKSLKFLGLKCALNVTLLKNCCSRR